MPELDPLPQRPRVPDFAPRTGDYAAVVGRAQHRRRRHLAGAGAGVAGVAVLVALTTGSAGGSFGLDPVQPATGVIAPEESPVPGESPTPEPTAEPSETPGETEAPGESGAPEESRAPRDEPRPSESAVVIDFDGDTDHPEDPPQRSKPYVLREDVAMETSRCETDTGPAAAGGWCMYYDGPESVRAGDVHPYRMHVCRHLGRGTGTLRYEGEQQVDFTVEGGGRTEWRWSGGYAFGKDPTQVEVGEGRCARWTVAWNGADAYGEHVRAGEYRMVPDLLVTHWGDALSGATAYGFSYPLEVTE